MPRCVLNGKSKVIEVTEKLTRLSKQLTKKQRFHNANNASSEITERRRALFTVVRPSEGSHPQSHVDFVPFSDTARHGGVLPGLHADLHARVQDRPAKVQGKHVLKAFHRGLQIHALATGGRDLT